MNPDGVAPAERDEVLTAAFYFALQSKDVKRLDSLAVQVSSVAENDSTASYLLGIYENLYKHDANKAKNYLSRARENGIWGRMLDVAGGHGVSSISREPAAQPAKAKQ